MTHAIFHELMFVLQASPWLLATPVGASPFAVRLRYCISDSSRVSSWAGIETCCSYDASGPLCGDIVWPDAFRAFSAGLAGCVARLNWVSQSVIASRDSCVHCNRKDWNRSLKSGPTSPSWFSSAKRPGRVFPHSLLHWSHTTPSLCTALFRLPSVAISFGLALNWYKWWLPPAAGSTKTGAQSTLLISPSFSRAVPSSRPPTAFSHSFSLIAQDTNSPASTARK